MPCRQGRAAQGYHLGAGQGGKQRFFQREKGGGEDEIFMQKERSEKLFLLNMSCLCIIKHQLKPGIEASRIRVQADGMRMLGKENLNSMANPALKCAAAGLASGAGEGGAQCDDEEQTLKPQKRVKCLRAEFLPGWLLESLNVSAQCSSGKAASDWSCQVC